MPISSGLPYDELVYHMDLCILSYALYTQSLIWPFDPYYEQMAQRFFSRRNTMMREVRTWANAGPAAGRVNYRGPGGAQGWTTNNDHDPVMYRYDRVRPWQPAACWEGSKWLLYDLPAQITNRIACVRVCQYAAGPAGPGVHNPDHPTAANPNVLAGTPQLGAPVPNLNAAPGAADIVYCFEGGTGGWTGQASSWSLMGFVFERHKAAAGHYDVHIAFRGSRSGSGLRALTHAAFVNNGNPDWVTDMDHSTMVQDPVFGMNGSISRGFSHAVKTCMPSIMECLRTIAAAHPGVAPDNIWVTGHSLGGALATLFSAAMIVGGEYGPNGQGNETPAAVRTWPWDRAKVITVSAPKCAGKRFHRNFNGKVYCRRVVLSTDPITKDPPRILSGRNAVKKHDLHHVGSEVYVTQATTVGHALNPVTLGDHEPKAIRRRLIHNLTEWGDLAAPLPAGCAHDPWNEYPNFNGMCGHTIMTDQNLRAIFAGMNAEVVQFLGVFNTTMGQNDAYRTMIRASVAAARTLAVTASIPRIGITTGKAALPARQALGLTASQIRLANPDLGLYLGLLMIIAEFGASAVVSKTMFANEPALLACVQ